MAKLAGKYQLVENKNFYEFLQAIGVPEERLKESKDIKGTLEIKVDGDKITLTNDTPAYSTSVIVGQEVEEKMAGDTLYKSTATLNGNVLSVSSTKEGSPSGSRTYTFSDSGLELTLNVLKDGKTISGGRVYKRI